MMNKVFIILLILTLAGAGLLFWLMRAMPTGSLSDPHAEKKDSLVVAKPEGVEVNDGHGAIEGGGHDGTKKSDHEPSAEPDKEHSKESTEPTLTIETEPVKAVVFVDGTMVGQTPQQILLIDRPQQVKVEAHGFKEFQFETRKKDPKIANETRHIILRAQPGALSSSPRGEMNSPVPNKAKAKPNAHASTKPADHSAPAMAEKPAATKPVVKSEEKIAAAPAVAEVPAPTENDSPNEIAEPAAVNAPNVLFLSGRSGPAWVQIQALPVDSRTNAEENIRGYRKALNLNVMGCTVAVKGKGQWIRILSGPFDTKTEAQTLLKSINSRLRDPAFVTGVQECL